MNKIVIGLCFVRGVIASLFEQCGNGLYSFWYGVRRIVGFISRTFTRASLAAMQMEARSHLIHAGDHGGTTAGTHGRSDKGMIEFDAFSSQVIDDRSFDGGFSIT